MSEVMAGIPDGPVSEVADRLEHLAATMTAEGRPISPEGVVEVARLAVPHAQHVGVTLLRVGRPPRNAAATDDVPVQLDALQFKLRDGPCLDAATGPTAVLAGDLRSDERWPRYGPRCVSTTGIRSMMCLRLPIGGTDHAGLNFYSQRVDAFSDDDLGPGSLLVPFAGLVLEADLRQQDVRHLHEALDTSRLIGTAVGVLMATHKLSRDAAFEVLRRASMDLNTKLRDVAEHVELTGVLPHPK